MGGYDSPGYGDRTPAGAVHEDTGFEGSRPDDVPTAAAAYDTTGTTMASAFVVPSGASTISGDRTPVGPLDTLVGLQADLYVGSDENVLSGGVSGDAVGFTGLGRGHVYGPGAA
jgi:hypothetical protein